jgi:hypothetical protein
MVPEFAGRHILHSKYFTTKNLLSLFNWINNDVNKSTF